ncbi:MAG TPA: hypothetical protein PLZ93_19420 [Nocardioides sp.]|uniref:hypothetical protein n=1 Tax=uncultured Nocardioides sp. TaxID=198441 RepID=UPI000ED0A259|nr:hypothetical protein [uncultured Nocardioides sp.]HCB03664.1 hypothetical protein [Nocardioides sp.]HRD62318.1 hypothetical protein [Nocardioides sp.]HRI97799.1 hypothetical protein [Nocardioides sp.]HRK45408.1 hypothetical protein [Nocardioides sp.]
MTTVRKSVPPSQVEQDGVSAPVALDRQALEQQVAERELEAGYAALALTISEEERATVDAYSKDSLERLMDLPYDEQ